MPKRKQCEGEVLGARDVTLAVNKRAGVGQDEQQQLTDEQLAVVRTPSSLEAGELLVVDAFAAVGKSFTSRSLIQAHGMLKFLYLVFNRKPRREAQAYMSRLCNVSVHTYHSWACEWMRLHTNYRLVVEAGCVRSEDDNALGVNHAYRSRLAAWLEAQPHLALGQHLSHDQRKIFWQHVVTTLAAFCLSAETTVGPGHAKLLADARHQAKQTRTSGDQTRRLWLPQVTQVVRVCNELVQATVAGRIRDVDFGMALKLVHLLVPEALARQFSTVIVDEAQDMPAVLVAILSAYRRRWGVVLFGDREQALYGWAGACNGMKLLWSQYLPENRHAYVLSRCFRFSSIVTERLLNPLFTVARQPLVAPILSAAKHTTTVHALPGTNIIIEQDDVCAISTSGVVAVVPRRVQKWSLARHVLERLRSTHLSSTHAILARNRVNLVTVLEDLGEEHCEEVTSPGIFCCPSVVVTLHETLVMCALSDEQLGVLERRRLMTRTLGWNDDTGTDEQHSLLSLVKNHPNRILLAQRLRTCLVRVCDDPAKARVHVFTVHSGKGLEWNHVYLCEDIDDAFHSLLQEQRPTDTQQLPTSPPLLGSDSPELPLVYVALSRPRDSLHLPERLWRFYQSTACIES